MWTHSQQTAKTDWCVLHLNFRIRKGWQSAQPLTNYIYCQLKRGRGLLKMVQENILHCDDSKGMSPGECGRGDKRWPRVPANWCLNRMQATINRNCLPPPTERLWPQSLVECCVQHGGGGQHLLSSKEMFSVSVLPDMLLIAIPQNVTSHTQTP